jgi:hypothetical protein
MLRLLCNENIPRALVAGLRDGGHEVAWMSEIAPGAPDTEVLRRAAEGRRICLTCDKDFRELAARHPQQAAAGVILLRLPLWPLADVVARLAALIDSRADWEGHFVVVEPHRLRMRPIAPDR